MFDGCRQLTKYVMRWFKASFMKPNPASDSHLITLESSKDLLLVAKYLRNIIFLEQNSSNGSLLSLISKY